MEGKNAEAVTESIVKMLENNNLDVQDVRGQTYDNAAVIAGVKSGVQARIKSMNPLKPCFYHAQTIP